MLDVLESRLMLTVSLSGGQLLIEGSGAADRVTATVAGSSLNVDMNGIRSSWDAASVRSLALRLGGGDDYANLSGVRIPVAADGDAGNDTIIGGGGNDTIRGGTGDDSIQGGQGNDDLYGNDGRDTLRGGLGVDSLHGAMGNDLLYGGEGADVMMAGSGDDWMDGGWGNDTLWGGDGFDTADYSSRTMLQQLRINEGSGVPGEQDIPHDDIECLIGGSGNDWIQGGGNNNLLIGGLGDDTLIGMGGNDTLIGGPGADLLGHDSSGPTAANGDAGNDVMYTNTMLSNDDGAHDRLTDQIGNNVLNYSRTDPDQILINWP